MTAAAARVVPAGYDVARVRRDFPILATRMNDRPLVYLDTAASAQKPRAVIDTLKRFYEQDYANIHRGVYDLSQRATAADDAARRKVQRFVNAADWREIVFTRNATEAINLVAASFLRPQLRPGDEILVTEMEHHANIVPWQIAAEADRCQGGGGPGERRRRAAARRLRRADHRAHPDDRRGLGLERAGHGQPGARAGPASPTRAACRS